jgi:signal transduction histidine kinase
MYGDDLSGFRTAVVNANKLHKVIRTFENGRCFAAYRAVYPIYDGDRHVGSVEMSMGFHDILDSLNKLYGNCFSYILEKEAVFKDYSGESVEKYKEISINDDFIMESCDSCSTESGLTCFSIDIENVLISSINQKIKAKLKNYERFSIIADEETSLVLNFFPVKDLGGNGLGYFISHSEEQEIKSLNFFYNALFVLITILIIFIIALFELMDYRRRKTRSLNILLRKKVKNMVKELTEKEQFLSQQSKMATMGEMLNSILHQWKQPVSSVSLICDMLLMEEEKLDKEMVKYIRTILLMP